MKRRAFLLVLTLAAPAAAGSKEDVAKADALFTDAQKLLQKGQVAEACAAFAESQRLDPANGTLLNLALCHEKEGKAATAQRELRELLANVSGGKSADDRERTKIANEHLKALEKKVARVTFDTAALPPDHVLQLDGERVTEQPVALDPGPHTVVANASKKKPGTTTFDVKEPGPRTVKIEALADDAPLPTSSEAPPPPPPPPPEKAAGGYWSGQRIAGAAVVGVGVVGLGVGTVFGLSTFSKRSERDEHCTATVCDAQGLALHDDAKQSATLSTIGFAVGGAAVIAGSILFFTAPRTKPKDADVALGPGGVLVYGRF